MRWVLTELRDWWTGQNHPESVAFDREHGTDTAWFDLFNYEPSLPSVVEACLAALDGRPEEWAFVDLGSGKGRVVWMAAAHGFREVWGVEHRRRLHRAALRNVQRSPARGAIHLVHADAASAPLPDAPLVLYLYNPFPAEVLGQVLDRVRGPAQLIYVNPQWPDVLEARGWTRVHALPHDDPTRRAEIYHLHVEQR